MGITFSWVKLGQTNHYKQGWENKQLATRKRSTALGSLMGSLIFLKSLDPDCMTHF